MHQQNCDKTPQFVSVYSILYMDEYYIYQLLLYKCGRLYHFLPEYAKAKGKGY